METTPQHDALLQKLGDLEASLQTQDPQIKNHLKEIHRTLIAHEELVHLLTDEQIGKIMQGQQIVTNTVLAASVTKKAASSKVKNLTLADF